ncbi:hypothetical protein GCM10009623_17740 [Nocardioides aestuarii]
MLVAVDSGLPVQVDDGRDPDVGVPEEVGEAGHQHRADALDAGDARLAGEGVLAQVDEDLRLDPHRGELPRGQPAEALRGVGQVVGRPCWLLRLPGVGVGVVVVLVVVDEELDQLGGAGEPAEGAGAELVAVVVVTVLDGQDVGDPVDHRVDPDRVAGVDAGDDGPQPELISAGQRDVAAVLLGLAAHGVGLGVGLDDLGGRDLQHRGGGVAGDRCRHGPVDDPDGGRRECTGEGGDLAGHPRLAVAGLDHGPHAREAVLEVEGVGGQRPGGQGVGLARHRQLRQRVLPHGRRPVPARRGHRVALGARFAVHHAPVGHHPHLRHLRRTPRADRLVGGVEDQLRRAVLEGCGGGHGRSLLEHVFEHKWQSS